MKNLRPCVVMCAALAAHSGVVAAETPAQSLPMSVASGFETVRLGDGERLGLIRGELLFELGPGWWAGPAVYGAVTGHRGGFFVGGGELQRRWQLGAQTVLSAGLYAGGGGGSGAPVGGGLMVRPALTLWRDLGGVQLGLSASEVRFPGGRIRSEQLGLALAWDGRFVYFDPALAGQQVVTSERTGLGFDRFALVASRYAPRASAQSSSAAIDTLGARAERWLGGRWWAGLEATGAARGTAGGYAEVLGTLAWEPTAGALGLPALSLALRASLGLGGGGTVPTDGGVIGKGAATLAWQLSPDYFVALEQGVAGAAAGRFRARETRLLLGMTLDRPGSTAGPTPATVMRDEIVLSAQHVLHAQRKNGPTRSLDTLGVKYDRYIAEHVYLTGQGHSAYAGGAGAYSVGLVGLGASASTGRLRYGAELLVGASGGGGVATRGGAIAQAIGLLGWRLTPGSSLTLSAGQVHALRGGLDSPLIELSWSQAFGSARHLVP